MFEKISRVVVAHPWRVIALWIVAVVVVVAFSPKLSTYTSNNNSSFLPSSYQSVQALEVAQKYFPAQSGATGTVVVSAANGQPLTSADQQKVSGLASALLHDHIPSLEAATTSSLYLSANKKVQLVQLTFSGQSGDPGPNAAVPAVRSATNAYFAGTGLTGGLTGNAAISVDSTTQFSSAEKIIAIATVVLILVLLGLVFRSVIIAVLPIVVIGVVHQMAQSLTADLAKGFGFVVGPELAPLLVVVMFGVGTDYIVFLLFRHREHVANGEDADSSLRNAVIRVGEVITSAAATVMAAFAALLVASLESLKTLAPGLIVGVLLMLLAAMTLVPAIMSLFGFRLFWPTHPTAPDPNHRTRAERLGALVARRPAVVLTVCAVFLLALASGIFGLKTTYNQLAELPSSTPSQQAYNTMASAFPPGALGPTVVYVTSSTPLTSTALDPLTTKLKSTTGVSEVLPTTFNSAKTAAEIPVLLSANPYSTTAMNDVAGPIRSATQGSVPGARVLVGGTTSQLVDVRSALKSDMLHVFPLALAIVAVILALLLRAIVAPLYLLVGVVLVYVATLGIVVYVFLDGLGYHGIDFTIPIVAYLFVMAIGTDYNILMASRLREEFNQGLPPHEAARKAITFSAPAITAAGLILAGTFASLLLTGIQLLEEIGLAVALGVLLAANVLATRIVPTLAALRGWRFWWPHSLHHKTARTAEELEVPSVR